VSAARAAALALLAILCAGCGAGVDNRQRAAGWLQSILIEQNYDAFAEHFADGARINDTSFTRSYLKSLAEGLHAAFPDLRMEVIEQIAVDDRVVTRFELTGTHSGAFNTMPATGRPVRFRGVSIDRLQDGRVTECWLQVDFWMMVRQISSAAAANS
jgi:predicted ester cyclase